MTAPISALSCNNGSRPLTPCFRRETVTRTAVDGSELVRTTVDCARFVARVAELSGKRIRESFEVARAFVLTRDARVRVSETVVERQRVR